MADAVVVPRFGGGLDFRVHPAFLRDDQWSWSEGWVARDGYAEILPGYTLVRDGAYLDPGGYTPIGLVQNAFDPSQAVIVVGQNGNPKLWKISDNGTTTAITWDAVGAVAGSHAAACAQAHYLANKLLISVGGQFSDGTSKYGLLKLTGDTNFGVVNGPTTAVKGDYFMVFAGHALLAVTGNDVNFYRQVKISDADDPDVWDVGVANSADEFDLEEIGGPITGLAPLGGNAAGIFTRRAAYALAASGGIPAFVRQLASLRGVADDHHSAQAPFGGPYLGITPYGTVIRGADDFYLAGSTEGIGAAVFEYYRQHERTQTQGNIPQFWFHDTRGVLYVMSRRDGVGKEEVLFFHPRTGAWSRRKGPAGATGAAFRHGIFRDNKHGTLSGTLAERHWIVTALGELYVERDDGVPAGGEFVDSRDFHIGNLLEREYIDRVKVDWEPLTNASTDAIEVLAAVRNDLSPSLLGSPGLESQGLTFTSLGTLTAGASELSTRIKGKFARLRFKQSSGRARVRGFTLRPRRAAHVRT